MGLLAMDQNKRYSITEKGEKALEASIDEFVNTFYDFDEIKSCLPKEKLKELGLS
jgi:DNA-binding PadR family transcriptional regulator